MYLMLFNYIQVGVELYIAFRFTEKQFFDVHNW